MSLNERLELLESIKNDILKKINNLNISSQADLSIDDIDLDNASIKTPNLFVKYNNMFTDEMINFRKLIVQKDKMLLERQKYLLGKQTNKYYSEYGIVNEKILKTDIDIYLKSDPLYSILNEIVSIQKIYIDSIEKICKEISGRGFHIKSAIEWRKFVSGG